MDDADVISSTDMLCLVVLVPNCMNNLNVAFDCYDNEVSSSDKDVCIFDDQAKAVITR